jgi:tetratricopeptide (TPR) repeat protein
MPRRDVQVISHSSLTNHLILARPDEPFPEAAFHQTTAALPDLIHVNPVPGRVKVTLSPLTLFQAYGELLDKKTEYLPRYLALLDKLAESEPHNALVQAALGRRDLRLRKFPEAIEHLQKAVNIGPPQTAAYADLAEALVNVNRAEEAMPFLEKALELDPFNTTLQRTKVTRLIDMKRYADAKTALEQYVARFPEDSFMRQMLARANQLTTR